MNNFFIGIDVSKETIDVSCFNPSQMSGPEYVGEYKNQPCGYRALVKDLRAFCGGIGVGRWLLCCETTGVYDRNLCKWACGKGLFIWRENALQINKSVGVRRGKDDKTDLMVITDYAFRHKDKAVRYELPSPALSALKELYTYRRALVATRTAVKSRLCSSRLVKDGQASRFICKDLEWQINILDDSIKKCEAKIKEVIAGDEQIRENYLRITSMKGIALVNAVAMIVFSGNFVKVPTANKLACAAGCAPFRKKSGTSIDKRSNVRKLSNRDFKGVMSMAAVQAIRFDKNLHDYAERLRRNGKPEKIIKNNVRNKLIHRAYALVRNGCCYDANHVYARNDKMRKNLLTNN